MSLKLKTSMFLIGLGIFAMFMSPQVDVSWSLIPFNPLSQKFYGEVHRWCQLVYSAVSVVTMLLVVVPLYLLLKNKTGTSAHKTALKRMILITYLSLAIGPGLIVNTVFKDNWGRARPYQVIRDHHPFSYPWQPHFNHPEDNSFPCGHGSIGAFIGVPFLAARRRKLGVALCVGGFVLVSTVRFLQGGHYFSDILMSGVIVWSVTLLVTELVDKYFLNKRAQHG